jgi:cyclopropane fatty-acyl-phospholipid synthase-like methyltransferase
MIPQNINNTFFEGFYKDVWRKLIPNGLTEAEADFIIDIAPLDDNLKVLDLMCGYGRHSIELAKRGAQVTAVDNSLEYIEEIKQASASNSLNIEALCEDVITISLDDVYDTAICMGNSFAFFKEEEVLRILRNLSTYIKRDGTFIINTWMIGEIAIRHYREKDWFYVDDYKYLVDNKYCFNPTRIESEHIIIRSDGETEALKGVDYIFTLAELQNLFEQTGFTLSDIYSTPRKKKFQFNDTRAYIVAKKL